jgi:hypothetical protein
MNSKNNKDAHGSGNKVPSRNKIMMSIGQTLNESNPAFNSMELSNNNNNVNKS